VDLGGRQWARDSLALRGRAIIMARGCRQVSLQEVVLAVLEMMVEVVVLEEEEEEEVVVVVVVMEAVGVMVEGEKRECVILFLLIQLPSMRCS